MSASFSLDLGNMISYAADIFNSLSPIVGLIGGIGLGMTILVGILSLVMNLKFR